MNGSKDNDTNDESAVTLEDGTTLRDYGEEEEEEVTVLGSKHEGFMRHNDDEDGDDEEEHKYDVEREHVDLPLDTEESHVKLLEARHPDREVMMPIDDDEGHISLTTCSG